MAIQIGRGSGNVVQIGNSDFPLDSFRALYGKTKVTLISKHKNLIDSPKLVYKYSELVDLEDAPLGDDMEEVRPKLQEILYSTGEVAPEPPVEEE